MKTKFNLQLFADGEESVMDTSADVQAENTPEPKPEPEPTPDVALRVDPETGHREFLVDDEIQPKEPEPEPELTPAKPDAYTADALFKDFAMGRVDESRVPQELEGYYVAIKTQQQNEQARQQLAIAQMQQQAAATPPQTPQENAGENRVAIYQQMEKYAREKAMADLGIKNEEELADLQYSENETDQQKYHVFNTAVQHNVQLISNSIAANQRQEAQRQEVTRQEADIIRNGLAEYQKSEPHFHDIDVMMETHYQNMPFEKAVPIAQTLSRVVAVFSGQPGAALLPNDKEVLNDYYMECKKAFYEKQTGVGTTPQPVKPQPPNVEHTGQTSKAPDEKVDWRSMRNMNPRERRAFFMNNI